ncbi:c-type cytochrome [Hyphomicrobium sp. xq]|uniref:C-type cytochrome n=1 Tax=Hyphomicrobium album TaxID=2665159 RepID=A0A6I3KM04_9HYPH|nr:cytochrome c family protein [Hyphomicrobium album]MTD96174.1 c-type cytochrome [Hyphomicrobium album]
MLKWVVAAGLVLALPAVASAQDAANGKKLFTKCAPCHAVGPGAKNKVGPELNGILDRAAASVEGFAYSDALKKSGLKWDDANLHKWLENPKALVPGTKMLFPGVKDEVERDDIIAYIESFNADGTNK